MTKPDGHGQSFLDALRANPGDDATRLAYADWLDHRGDPRGEYIRLRLQSFPTADLGRDRKRILTRLAELQRAMEGEWVARVFTDLTIPDDLDAAGRRAARLIHDFLAAEGVAERAACKAFYSPAGWKARGGKFSRGCLLMVRHDTGPMLRCFCPDLDEPEPVEDSGVHAQHVRLVDLLHAAGFRLELRSPRECSRVCRAT
jgi:uncharacterized protein (TIGR02996 family)